MKSLTILFHVNDESFISTINQIYNLGHLVEVSTNNQAIKDFCDTELINIIGHIKKESYDLIVSENFSDILASSKNYLLIPVLSCGALGTPAPKGAFGYWRLFEYGVESSLVQPISIDELSIPMRHLDDQLIELVTAIARENQLCNVIPDVSQTFIKEKTLNLDKDNFYTVLLNLIQRYFGKDSHIVAAKNELRCGDLDNCYDISPLSTIQFSTTGLILISLKPIGTNTLTEPDALLFFEFIQGQFLLKFHSNQYIFRNFLEHLLTLANGYKLGKNIMEIPFLAPEEMEKICFDFNAWHPSLPQKNCSIIDVFTDIVRIFKNKTAIIFNDEQWTYEQLDHLSNKIALHIIQLNLIRQTPIALAIDRSPLAIASILGILKSGNCYVPIDPSYPQERIAAILSDTQTPLCLSTTTEKSIFQINFDEISTLWVDEVIQQQRSASLSIDYPQAKDLAYIIYTSGSTGTPKGVMIEHINIINLVQAEAHIGHLNSDSVILNVASLGFDAAGWDIYGALLTGGTLVIAPKHIQISPDELHTFINEKKITFATLTPAILALMPRERIPSLETLIVMGDVCPHEVMCFWSESVHLYNGYGPTEATIGATMSLYQQGKDSRCIGKPFPNYQVYILDGYLNVQPIGSLGEIYIAGVGLARGYYNNELLTSERFLLHRFSEKTEPIRLYKTGDLGYWTDEGELIFVGREDHQIKIRGIRLELREVEIVLEKLAFVKQALILVAGDGANKHLIAYLTLKNKATDSQTLKQELIDYLKDFFHPSVIPQSIMILESFALNTNGKIDRKNLPKPDYDIGSDRIYEIAATYQEKIIAKIIQELLQKETISIKQNIFDLGIHSLIAAQIIARVNEFFKIRLSTKDIFVKPTVYELALLVQNQKTDKICSEIIIKSERKGPLTSAQQRLWFLQQLNPIDTRYNLPFALELHGPLDVVVFSKAWEYIVQKHESFHLVFDQEKGIPYQKACTLKSNMLPVIDITKDELDNYLEQQSKNIFSLADTPPFLVALLRISSVQHVLFFVKHNIITDAWSEGLIINDLSKAYCSLLDGENLPDLIPFPQIIDAASFRLNTLDTSLLNDSLAYWQDKLSEHTILDFPVDLPRPNFLTGHGFRYSYIFKNITWKYLQQLSENKQSTIFMLLTALLNILLSKYSGQTDIILGTALAGRETESMEKITGFFVNTIPLRTIFSCEDSLENILHKTKMTCIDAYKHQHVEFESIVDVTKAERFLNKNPLFQMMLVLQNAGEGSLPTFGSLSTKRRLVQTNTSMFDLVWNFSEQDNYLALELDYSTELFVPSTIERLVENFENILINIEHSWSTSFEHFIFSSTKEKELVTRYQQGPEVPLDATSILVELEKQSNKYSNRIAVRTDKILLTYADLWHQSSLMACGISTILTNQKSAQRIGILMTRSEQMILAILATLKSGNIYIPLDPAFPQERIAMMLEDSQVSLVITDGLFFNNLDFPKVTTQHLAELGKKSSTKLPSVDKEDLAYILYTSGSTGRPKGVMINHRNLLNLAEDFVRRLELKESDRFLSITTISFDIFGLELFCTLLAGAELILCQQEIAKNPVYLVNYINEQQPTIMQATPTMWSMIVEHLSVTNDFTILCGGEALSLSLLNKLQQKSTRVMNVYGPTETTIWSTVADLTTASTVHIGKPIANTNCLILDDHKNPVPIGGWGDLYISGQGVSNGYWQQPELTKTVFININNEYLYKTGDKAKWNFDGNIVFGGRSDMQIKLRGHRIELGEIEAVIATYPLVQQVIVYLQNINNNPLLVAYIIKEAHSEALLIDDLRKHLENNLPVYMIPSAFIELKAIPLTPNKKIDWKKLPIPDENYALSNSVYVSPQNEMEVSLQKIWQSALNVKNLSVVESFFNLGGHSLHIPQIVSKINSHYSIALTIRDFILHSTVRDLARFLMKST